MCGRESCDPARAPGLTAAAVLLMTLVIAPYKALAETWQGLHVVAVSADVAVRIDARLEEIGALARGVGADGVVILVGVHPGDPSLERLAIAAGLQPAAVAAGRTLAGDAGPAEPAPYLIVTLPLCLATGHDGDHAAAVSGRRPARRGDGRLETAELCTDHGADVGAAAQHAAGADEAQAVPPSTSWHF